MVASRGSIYHPSQGKDHHCLYSTGFSQPEVDKDDKKAWKCNRPGIHIEVELIK